MCPLDSQVERLNREEKGARDACIPEVKETAGSLIPAFEPPRKSGPLKSTDLCQVRLDTASPVGVEREARNADGASFFRESKWDLGKERKGENFLNMLPAIKLLTDQLGRPD